MINLLLLRVTLTTSWLGLALALLGLPGLLCGLLSSDGLGAVVLRHGLDNGLLLLGLDDGDGVGQSLGWAGLALGVGAAHYLNLDTEDTLAEQDVAGSVVNEVLGGLTGVDHETVLYDVSMPIPTASHVRMPTVNFMLLARAALSFPETTTSQPLAPDSMMNLRTP